MSRARIYNREDDARHDHIMEKLEPDMMYFSNSLDARERTVAHAVSLVIEAEKRLGQPFPDDQLFSEVHEAITAYNKDKMYRGVSASARGGSLTR